ncbi:uncharacterized protein LOC107006353 [Solanum pennellii]|uniref:Uncharacterized protein LOC107006353 n=1 Tax=Solanum pennellii TaxID=28526 RepID=A0ABM1FQW6_SOLPN|nr:uncharacterized protein LOC107006353 [Solanum pennellii]
MLEGQLNSLATQIVSRTRIKNDDKELAVVAGSGKVAIGKNVEVEKVQDYSENKVGEEASKEEKCQIRQDLNQGGTGQHNEKVRVAMPMPKISPLFPELPKKRNEEEKFKKSLSVFKNLSINLPLVDALLEMPVYAKFMKDLVTKKRSLDYEIMEIRHSCNAIMPKELTIKKKRRSMGFYHSLHHWNAPICKTLCDRRASIKMTPYTIYEQLVLGEPKSTIMRLLVADISIKHPVGILYDILVKVFRFIIPMADISIKHPVGILYDILVKVDRFIIPTDFVIFDCDIDAKKPITLGKPFLAIEIALVVVESGKLKFRVNDDEVTFNICRSMMKPSDSM